MVALVGRAQQKIMPRLLEIYYQVLFKPGTATSQEPPDLDRQSTITGNRFWIGSSGVGLVGGVFKQAVPSSVLQSVTNLSHLWTACLGLRVPVKWLFQV